MHRDRPNRGGHDDTPTTRTAYPSVSEPHDAAVEPWHRAGHGAAGSASGDHAEDAAVPERTESRAGNGPVTARRVTHRLLAVSRSVADASGRDAAEQAVCERLVASGFYRSAWVGVRAPDGDGFVVRTSAGFADSGDADGGDADGATVGGDPSWREAVQAGGVHAADAAALTEDAWPQPDRGIEDGSVAVVPLLRDGDALLAVQTSRPNALGELERAGLAALGTALGLAVDASRNRDLFFADARTEVDVSVTDPRSLLVRVSRDRCCRLTLDGYTARGDTWQVCCDVEGTDVEAFTERVDRNCAVEDCRAVVRRTDGGRLEFETADVPLLDRATAAGTTVASAVADRGTCRATIELPASGDVCETVGRLKAAFPDLEFLACRDVDGQPADPTDTARGLEDVTDRQREALEAAYDAGYFEWPRANTAEEIAPELGITSPTLLCHLRAAERQLLASILE